MADDDELLDLLSSRVRPAADAAERSLRVFTSAARWARDTAAAPKRPKKLPNLGGEILHDNMNALAAVYLAAVLEQLKLFAVADRVAQSFVDGVLPVEGPAGDRIFRYSTSAHERLTETERGDVYARAFGFGAPSSPPPPPPNVQFTPLWDRFLAAVARAGENDGGAATRAAAGELARNLSRHGGGTMHGVAMELQRLVRDVVAMLSAHEVLAAYGVGDVWQLVEQVSALSLGGAVNTVALRIRAQRGAAIMQWLADHASQLTGERSALDPRADPALRSAAESWLAAAADP